MALIGDHVERGVHLLLPQQVPPSRTKRRSVAVPATGTSELAEALGENRSVMAVERFRARDGRTPNASARVALWGKSRASDRFSVRRTGASESPDLSSRPQIEAA